MTYRELLEAIQVATDLQRAANDAAVDPTRWSGTTEEKDEAEARLRSVQALLDQQIEL